MKKTIAAVMMVVASQAHAWGDREQGIVTGIAGTLLFQHITQPRPQPQYGYGQPPVVVGSAPPIVVAPPPPPVGRIYNLPRQGLYPPGRPVYEERVQWDITCNCYVRYLNQIGWD